MSEYIWQCPYCGTDQPVTDNERQVAIADLTLPNADGPRRLVTKFVVCPNAKCRKFSLTASMHGREVVGTRVYTGKHLTSWNLVPPSRARAFPVSLPPDVLEDYHEACLTLELSPKVSAALSRRCLSAMLRDYWRVQPGSLNDELRQIKGTADPLTWEAIESVRRSGMIGARMEAEGAEVQDTDPGEAELLIGLIETLIQDWYIAREERRKRLQKIRLITGEETAEQKVVNDEAGMQ
jgi:hypothetical protein